MFRGLRPAIGQTKRRRKISLFNSLSFCVSVYVTGGCDGRWDFHCHSGECIAIYDACNGIKQCQDGSDEDGEACPSTTTTKRPRAQKQEQQQQPDQQVPRPDSVAQWGREGERYNPYLTPQQQQQQQQQQQSAFRQRGNNNGVQIPYQQQPQWASQG